MPAESASERVGEMLRAAREQRGLSLREIATATKISVVALEALERHDVSRLPGGIFTRAFVRSYAIEVGLDPEETIREFMAEFPHESVTAGHPESVRVEDNEAFESQRRAATVFVKVAALSVPIAVAVFYFGSIRQPSEAPRTPVASATSRPSPPVPPAANPAPDLAPPDAPAIAPAVAAVPVAAEAPRGDAAVVAPLKIGLSVNERCWVSVTVDGNRVLQRELVPGESQSFDARTEVVLTAGNAAAVVLTLNGVAARPFGKAGEVVTRRVTPANLASFLPVR